MTDMTETENELNNVVAFPVADQTDPKEKLNFLLENEGHYCHHPAYYISEIDRNVKCRKCGALVDPFAVLLGIAKKEARLAGDVRALREEERQRRANIDRLIQIERNAKARIRRAGGKV
ncbi:hypothetical protein KCT17_003669 [Escherichia coli]|nr:hypothetical protein [Escherichia coli]